MPKFSRPPASGKWLTFSHVIQSRYYLFISKGINIKADCDITIFNYYDDELIFLFC